MKTIKSIVNLLAGIVSLPFMFLVHFIIAFVITLIIQGYNIEHRKPGDWILTWTDYKEAKQATEQA
jgi:hypothetical protein